MTTSTKQRQPDTAAQQPLVVVVATIRWNGARASGLCADCGRYVAPGALPRALVHVHTGPIPGQLARLSMVAPNTHAESAHVDEWMRSTMERQQRMYRRGMVVSRAICFSCAVRLMNGYLNTDGGTLTGALAAITDDVWSALLMRCEPGYGHALDRLALNGRGKTPPLAELLRGVRAAPH